MAPCMDQRAGECHALDQAHHIRRYGNRVTRHAVSSHARFAHDERGTRLACGLECQEDVRPRRLCQVIEQRRMRPRTSARSPPSIGSVRNAVRRASHQPQLYASIDIGT